MNKSLKGKEEEHCLFFVEGGEGEIERSSTFGLQKLLSQNDDESVSLSFK